MLQIASWEGDGYSMSNLTFQEKTEFKLDGKEDTPKGPRVPKGTTVSGKSIDAHTMELTSKLKATRPRLIGGSFRRTARH